MSVPGAVGSVFLVWVQSALLIAGAVAGAPLFMVVVCAVAPLAWLVGRQGSNGFFQRRRRLLTRAGNLLGVVSAQLAPILRRLVLVCVKQESVPMLIQKLAMLLALFS